MGSQRVRSCFFLYIRHEVVRNKFVVDDLRKKGAVFVEDLADVPDASTFIFSAHGVSKSVSDEAERRGFNVFNATSVGDIREV